MSNRPKGSKVHPFNRAVILQKEAKEMENIKKALKTQRRQSKRKKNQRSQRDIDLENFVSLLSSSNQK
jgi:bifunctional ADP-heptose synthase (sugar kinase/adenylyltransferase)